VGEHGGEVGLLAEVWSRLDRDSDASGPGFRV